MLPERKIRLDRFLRRRLDRAPGFALWHPTAVHYDSWRSLAAAGLLF